MKKVGKAAVIPILLVLSLSTVPVSADTYYDFVIYDPEKNEYYSASHNSETGEMLIDHTPIYFYSQGSESEVGDGKYKGYNLYYEYPDQFSVHNDRSWWWEGSKKSGYTIYWVGGSNTNYDYATIKIPDSINGVDVVDIKGSCDFKAFDLNSKNKHLKCADNVVFSKDGKRLIAYAQYDKRCEYAVPEGTEIIERKAIWNCPYLRTITIPDSVTEIRENALASSNYNLSLVNFYDFYVMIDRGAFGSLKNQSELMLKSGVTVVPKSQGNTILWDKVSVASYYEIYQKLNNGEYKLLKTTKDTACKFTTLKSGKNYTFAVKPVAVIPAENFDKEKDEGVYPKSFTIEGTMSEDIVLTGK